MTTERKAPMQTCTDHCAGCNRHFHGLTAFDAHRRGGECQEPSEIVGEKSGEHTLRVWTDEGNCDKMRGCWHDGKRLHFETPVTIWQMNRDAPVFAHGL